MKLKSDAHWERPEPRPFFVPLADSDEQAERVYQATAEHVSQGGGEGFSKRRVQALRWVHDGSRHVAIVGEETSFNGELVIAILLDETRDLYHVCTPSRGVRTGGSIMASASSVASVVDFLPTT